MPYSQINQLTLASSELGSIRRDDHPVVIVMNISIIG